MIKNVIRLNRANKGSGAGSSCDAKNFPDLLLLYTPSLWDEKVKYTKLRSHRVFKKWIAMTLLPSSSHWQNSQRKDKFLCEDTVRGLNDSGLWDMEPHITRWPALIHPRLVVTESLSKLSSLPVYLKELMASAQQIPVGRDLSQHALGM